MARAVAKWARAVTAPALIEPIVREALAVARSGRPGSAYVELPDRRAASAGRPTVPARRRRPRPIGSPAPRADAAAVERAVAPAGGRRASRRRGRRRGVLGGRRRPRCAASSRPPVIPVDHHQPRPRAAARRPCRVPGLAPPRRCRRWRWPTWCSSSAAGSTATSCSAARRCGTPTRRSSWSTTTRPAFALNRPPTLGLHGDAAAVLEQLADAWTGEPTHGVGRRGALVGRGQPGAVGGRRPSRQATGVHPGRAGPGGRRRRGRARPRHDDRARRRRHPRVGPGVPAGRGARVDAVHQRRPRHHRRRGAVRGRRAARPAPTGRTVALIGDGAFGLSAMEIETAVRAGAAPVIVVSNNAVVGRRALRGGRVVRCPASAPT